MAFEKQRTLARGCSFEGKGLHTGKVSRMTVRPAAENTGILFHRVDLGPDAFVRALAENVSSTARSTTIVEGGASVSTTEHLLSALTGMGVDNAVVELDNVEVPILDGSARPYVEAFSGCGLTVQEAERKRITITEEIEVRDEETGSFVKVAPSRGMSMDLTLDFGSKVLGVQKVHWDESVDYSTQIGPCRTFVFFHEIEFLFNNNLVKGGDVDNAIVIVERPVSPGQLERLAALFDVPRLQTCANGYLNNLDLHFPDECGRHKVLDMIGDIRLVGGWLDGTITAFKPGHSLNTRLAKAIREVYK